MTTKGFIQHHFSTWKMKLEKHNQFLVHAQTFRFVSKSGAGFTLPETLVVIALLLVVMVVGLEIFVNNNRFYEGQTGQIELTSNSREAADRIAEYGREAVAFEPSYTYDSVLYTTAETTVIFRLPGRDASGDILTGIYDYAIVTVDPNNSSRLLLIVDPDATSARPEREHLLSERLTALEFTYDNVSIASAGSVSFEISFAVSGRVPSAETIYGQVTLRN